MIKLGFKNYKRRAAALNLDLHVDSIQHYFKIKKSDFHTMKCFDFTISANHDQAIHSTGLSS